MFSFCAVCMMVSSTVGLGRWRFSVTSQVYQFLSIGSTPQEVPPGGTVRKHKPRRYDHARLNATIRDLAKAV